MAQIYNPPHYRDFNIWKDLPDSEIDRLQKTLYGHIKKMNIVMKKKERIVFVQTLLLKQNNTCAFGKKVKGMYCWNEPRENYPNGEYIEKEYLKLHWGHIKPVCRKEEQRLSDLRLLCSRCNNQIQTSRKLSQIKLELLSKVEHIEELIKELDEDSFSTMIITKQKEEKEKEEKIDEKMEEKVPRKRENSQFFKNSEDLVWIETQFD